MDNFKITIAATFLLTCICLTFTSCREDSLLADEEVTISETGHSIGQITEPGKDTKGTAITPPHSSVLDTVYVQWKPWVLESRKAEIRAEYSDVHGDVYLLNFTICPVDDTIEKWVIVLNDYSDPTDTTPDPKDRTPDPLSGIPDDEGEVDRDPSGSIAISCPSL